MFTVLVAVLTALAWPGRALAVIPPLVVGFSSVDITPAEGYPLSGYYHERGADGTLDPLQAKAVYFQQQDAAAVLVVCDVIGIHRQLSAEIRRQAAAATGIPAEKIIIAATHTHTGPAYVPYMKAYLQKQAAGEEATEARERYIGTLIDRVVRAVSQATRAATRAELDAGFGRCDALAFNRRFHMTDGSVRFNPGIGNPDIVRPAGPVDPQVGMVLVRRSSDRKPIGALVNFAMHLDTVGGTKYSADYPYFLEQSLRREFGEEFVCVFATGTCGDVNHINVGGPPPSRGPLGITRTAGQRLAESLLAARPQFDGAGMLRFFHVRRAIVDAPLQTYTDEDLRWAEGIVEQDRAGKRLPFLEEVRAYKLLRLAEMRREHGDTLPLEVQALVLGDRAAVVTFPGEIFVELGLAVKQRSPFATTLVVELANSSEMIYIPTRKAYDEGSYEVVNSLVAAGSGEMLVEAALRLLDGLKKSNAER
jgi:hypothetical protein